MNKFTALKKNREYLDLEEVVGPRFARIITINKNNRATNKKGEIWKILL